SANRIGDVCEYDRHGACRLEQRRYSYAAGGQNDVRRERNQFHCVSANVFGITSAPTDIDPNVAAYDPAQLLQSLLERRDASPRFRIGLGRAHEHATVAHTVGLLRLRRERPCRSRTTKSTEKLPSPHVRP